MLLAEAGIEAAFTAGMYPIMIPDLTQPNDETKSKAYRVLNNLNEVIRVLL